MELYVVANDVIHFKQLNKLSIKQIIVSSKFSSYRNGFSLDEIIACHTINQELIVSFYDLINESNIDEVTSYLDTLIANQIKKFIVNDVGLISYLQDKDCYVILDNIALNTNYESINLYTSLGVNNVVLSREITLEEINDISINTNDIAIVHVQGLFPIFTSIRSLLSNYQAYYKLDKQWDKYQLFDRSRQNKYRIIEQNNKFIMFSAYEQCSIGEINNLKVTKLLIDQPFVSNKVNLAIVKMYLDYEKYQLHDVQILLENKQSLGFLYKRTLYKL